MSSYSSDLRICSKTSRMSSHSVGKLQRLGPCTFGKALNNAMKQGGLPGIDAWICPCIRAKAQASRVRCLERGGHRCQNLAENIRAGSLDQCSVGRRWTFHAKLQMRLLPFTIWDLYHRMWNDIRAGVLAAKGQRFLLFAYKACNARFGSWNTHANFDSKKAWFSAWLSSSCASSQWFLENLQELAHDRGILVPVGEASVKVLFESLKECTSLSAIGAQPRMYLGSV